MDTKTFGEVYETVPKKLTEEQLKAQIVDLNRKLEAHKLLALYVQDLIDMWPKVTLRTLWTVTNKVADLTEALKLTK